jgi:hypothetical protein
METEGQPSDTIDSPGEEREADFPNDRSRSEQNRSLLVLSDSV